MTRKSMAKLLLSLILVGQLIGCTTKQPATPTPPAGGGAKPPAAAAFKVGMSTDIGGLNDNSFNAAAWRGLQRAQKELGAEVKAVESKRNEDYETNFRTLMDLGYNLIWGIGFMMHDITDKMAAANPNQKFGIIDSAVEKRPNVASVLFKEEEGSFLMGVMAARTTKSKVVGFVGGMDFDVIHHFDAGFQAGIKAVDPTVRVIRVYSGAFDNPVKGKSDAQTIFSQGADIIFHAAGATGQGVIEAAKDQGKFAIGVDSDQSSLAPGVVISSMIKRVDNAVFDVSRMAKEGKFAGGTVTTMGLKENGVGYAESTLWDKMPPGTKELVDKWADAIKAGKVTVPNDPKLLDTWKAPTI